MSNKNKVLTLLEKNSAEYISGQQISEEINISRNAVWKIINNLKEQGYRIESKTNKGYKLLKDNDILSEEGIRKDLKEAYRDVKIMIFDSVDSTNNVAKKLAIDANDIFIITANEQTAGRGRRGRSFLSPSDNGIYLSVVLRPKISIEEVYFSTILTVTAVHRVLTRLSGQQIEIKWVNDLFLSGKKICGILTELVSDVESMGIDFIVAGIGINVNSDLVHYPDELRDIVGSVKLQDINRNKIIAEIVNELLPLFDHFDKDAIIEEYKASQMLMGQEVVYVQQDITKTGTVLDIDRDGGLVILQEGKSITLSSGEVSVKLKK